jgi:hypothetical protein
MGDNILRELVYGKGAHVDPVACVEDISAELASRTVAGCPHSIWQIVGHMTYWMDYDLGTVAGESRPYPERRRLKAGRRIRVQPPAVARPIASGRRRFAASPICWAGLRDSRKAMRRSWRETYRNWARRNLLMSPRSMPCCGKLRHTTVIMPARLPCFVGSLAPGLRDEAAIPGERSGRTRRIVPDAR